MSPKYAIQQTNTSSKILDNQKYHKYFSKRKMMAQYEMEMRNEKKNKMSPTQDEPMPFYGKSVLPPPQIEPEPLTVKENNNNTNTTNHNTTNNNNNSANSNNNNNNNTATAKNNNSVANNNNTITNCSDVIQNIKIEPDTLPLTRNNDSIEDDEDSNSEYYLADLRKRKHSTSSMVEQSIALTTASRVKEASAACS